MSVTGTAGSILRAAGDLFGGILGSAGNSAYEIQRAVGGKAHDSAAKVHDDFAHNLSYDWELGDKAAVDAAFASAAKVARRRAGST